MDNIDISFGDDVLISQEPGINVDEQNNVDVVSDTIGIPGEKGEPGFSPIAYVNQTENGAIISITDDQGTTTATVLNGEDGVSPSASVTQTASGAVIEITDANGTTTANVSDGEPGSDGQNATITIGSVTSLSYGSTPTVTNTGTATNAVLNWGIPEGQQGEQGIQGIPGINAQAYVTQNTGSATITIEDADGTTTATVYDGQNGTNGQDGYSPTASVTQNTGSATISITDQNGTTTATVYDGTNGTDGQDGYSPTATVTQSGGTTTITITDKNGTTTESITIPTQLSDLSGTISTSQIANSAVNKSKLSGMPGPDFSNTLNDWGTITSTTTKSITADGFICGKALLLGSGGAYITINSVHVAGFPYNGNSQNSNLQMSFCIPVKSGMSVAFNISSNGQFQSVKQVGWQM